MDFIERVKSVLLERNKAELLDVEARIEEVRNSHLKEADELQRLKAESQEASKERSEVQKNILNKKDLARLEIIYNFVANYAQIDKVIEKVREVSELIDHMPVEEYSVMTVDEEGNFFVDEELLHREKLLVALRRINTEVAEILEEEPEEKEENQEENNDSLVLSDEVSNDKKNFFERLFKRGKNKTETVAQEKAKPEIDNKRTRKRTFNKYRELLLKFDGFYSGFIMAELDGMVQVVEKQTANLIMANIKTINTMEKRGIDLEDGDYIYLHLHRPHDLWREISKYYSQTLEISLIVNNFARYIDEFETIYAENPELFDVKNLEKIFSDNNQMVATLKQKNKKATEKTEETFKQKQSEKEKREKLKALEEKRTKLKASAKQIAAAKSIKDLGYKNKQDVVRKLEISSKDYIVIPIKSGVRKLSELFSDEKRLKIELNGNQFYAAYNNDVATGRINHIENDPDVDAVLLVPINDLKKDDIDSVRGGKISVNKSALNSGESILMKLDRRGIGFDFEGYPAKVVGYSYGDLLEHVKEFLGDDLTVSLDETINYDIFKNIPSISSKEKRLKKDAVKDCVIDSVREAISSQDVIHVNGKAFFLGKEDEKDIRDGEIIKPLDEKLLLKMASDIESYIIYDGKDHNTNDELYQKLMVEYLRVNRKAKADYYEEDDTLTTVNGRKVSIKPILPAKNETIAKRYTRTREDITYKAMKLAALVNKFAHLTENEELKNALYEVKLELIEHAIDLSADNPNINLRKLFDKDKMVLSVILEIPGYNMIALHAMKKSSSLSYKANRLEDREGEVFQTSAILIPGVNKDLLTTMKSMDEVERTRFLTEMDPKVFYKLAIRMGYESEKMKTEEQKKAFIKLMISDKKIEELLKGTDELEK